MKKYNKTPLLFVLFLKTGTDLIFSLVHAYVSLSHVSKGAWCFGYALLAFCYRFPLIFR